MALSFCTLLSTAQIPCDSILPTFQRWNTRLDQLNTEDPEIVSLHYLFLQDIRAEMQKFRANNLSNLTYCVQLDYYHTLSLLNKLSYKADHLDDILGKRKEMVDVIFYEKACEELAFFDTVSASYYIDRALEYNKWQPQALLLKAHLALNQDNFNEAVNLIHILYTKVELTEEMEMQISDFTLILYEKLYTKGNTLSKNGHDADALEIFLALEQFCSNMPSGYCNEDYYKAILRSREGVYDSYIAIAKEAERRHNPEMAKKFYRYAEEYRNK